MALCGVWYTSASRLAPCRAYHVAVGWNTLARMRNLAAVRGHGPGERMIGPLDYFGNMEAPRACCVFVFFLKMFVCVSWQPPPTVLASPLW